MILLSLNDLFLNLRLLLYQSIIIFHAFYNLITHTYILIINYNKSIPYNKSITFKLN